MKALREGLYVKHEQYGLGVILESDSERTSIDFDDHGKKKFVTSMMMVETVADAPVKPSRLRRSKKSTSKVKPAA